MGYTERSNQIMDLLRKNGTVQVFKLSEAMQTSVVTIRKDLQRMEEAGLLRRTHGGAVAIGEMTVDSRREALDRIAQ